MPFTFINYVPSIALNKIKHLAQEQKKNNMLKLRLN